jgi:hypothetical protein
MDTVIVIAECDSLEMRIVEYEREARDFRDSRDERDVTVNAPEGGFSIKWFLFGAAAGMILMGILFIILKFK